MTTESMFLGEKMESFIGWRVKTRGFLDAKNNGKKGKIVSVENGKFVVVFNKYHVTMAGNLFRSTNIYSYIYRLWKRTIVVIIYLSKNSTYILLDLPKNTHARTYIYYKYHNVFS